MRKGLCSKQYQKLTVDERTDLLFLAVKRNDREEAKRLMRGEGTEVNIFVHYMGENPWIFAIRKMKDMTDSEIRDELAKLEAERERLNREGRAEREE